ncbi:hypothetical protein FQR65_LT04579 [Abscondita terminalis]|nr:hypothetical protein FQR65_LT04579 [Abscondita terminalis]
MKHLIIFAIVFCSASAEFLRHSPKSPRIFENEINATLNDIQQGLAQNDPLSIPEINLELNSDVFGINLTARDIIVIDYSKFVATKIKVNILPPSMTLNIFFPKPHFIVTSYDLSARLLFIPVYGKGSINFAPKNIDLGIEAVIGIGGSGITVSKASPTLNLTESLLHITGILNNEPLSQIVSSSTTECFPKFLANYGQRFKDLLGPIIAEVLNSILGNLALKDNLIPKPGTISTHAFEHEDLKGNIRVRF